MRLLYVVLCLFCFFWQRCKGVTEIDLYFNSNNCDEEPRRISGSKAYNLTWDGQIYPKLCSFTFTGGEHGSSNVYDVCFVSLVYDLPSSMGDVQIKIKNYTKSSWDFNRFDRNIPRTCVNKAYKMTITIIVPTGYIPPSPETYLQLEVTAVLVEAVSLTIIAIIVGIIFGVVFVCCVCIGFGKGSDNCFGNCIGGICECCGEILQACIKCECLSDCESPSCDCDYNCKDICEPCGECCTAWAGCCTTMIVSARQNNSNQQSNVQTEIDEISQDTEQNHITTSTTGFIEQPPSYHSIKGAAITEDPLVPPPSYEEVTQKTVPSAPPLAKYYK